MTRQSKEQRRLRELGLFTKFWKANGRSDWGKADWTLRNSEIGKQLGVEPSSVSERPSAAAPSARRSLPTATSTV